MYRRWWVTGIPFAAVCLLAWATYQSALLPASLNDYEVFSVQMHLHGSMSEGSGSMRGANVRAKQAGVDVLWWTDHDWRVYYHTYISGFGFEAESLESEGPVPYPPEGKRRLEAIAAARGGNYGGYFTTSYTLEPASFNGSMQQDRTAMSSERAMEGTRSLKVAATARSGGFAPNFYTLDVGRRRAKRSLASNVRLRFAMYIETPVTIHTMYGFDLHMSQQPPHMDRVHLRYVVTGLSEAELRAMSSDRIQYVKLAYTPGQWNRYDLPVTRDAERLGLGGGDNNIGDASFGLELRGAKGIAYFDDYRIAHDLEAESLLAKQRQMAQTLTEEFGTINYVGQEMSYRAHLNALGDSVPMIDYQRHPLGLEQAETADFIRQHGGASTLNHIFGTSRPPSRRNILDPADVREWENSEIEELDENYVYGADMLEVGYPVRILPITSFLRVWDELSRRQVYVTGNGISDTHGNSAGGWLHSNNYVTWVWAKSKSQQDIIDALQAGRAFFGDPAQFQGLISMTTPEGYRMGQVVQTNEASHEVNIEIVGLPMGARVEAIVNGEVHRAWTAQSMLLRRSLRIETGAPTYVRINIWREDGKGLVFSNPLYFTPTVPERGIPEKRRVVHGG